MATDLASSPLSLLSPCCASSTAYASSSNACSVSSKTPLPPAISSVASSRPPFISSSSAALGFLASSFHLSASAVSYDDVAAPSPSPLPPPSAPVFDFNAVVDSVSDFVITNPIAVFAGVAAVGLPILVSALLAQPKSSGSVSAKDAFKILKEQGGDTQLLDIRIGNAVKTEGTPDLRVLRKKAFQVSYLGEDDAFLKKLRSKIKDPTNTSLYLLDEYTGNSTSVAKLLATNGFKSAYAIKDGAEGRNGWRSNELPWLLPRKGFSLDVSSLKSAVGENSSLVPATLGVAAAAGVGLVVFSEAETALQILGSAALLQLFVKRFLFAEDRKKTLKEMQNFLDTKIAPKELVDELKGISQVLLPKYDEVPIVDSTNGAVTSESGQAESGQVDTAEEGKQTEVVSSSDVLDEKQTEVASSSDVLDGKETKVVSSSDVSDGKETEVVSSSDVSDGKETEVVSSSSVDLPESSTPLSPYTQFPDLKPPVFPTASRP